MVHYSTYMLNADPSAVETAPAEKGESSGGHSHAAADSTCHVSGSGTFLAVLVALGDGLRGIYTCCARFHLLQLAIKAAGVSKYAGRGSLYLLRMSTWYLDTRYLVCLSGLGCH